MLGFTKQTFIVLVLMLLGFVGSLVTEYASINNQPCMVRPILTDLNPDELHYYPFIISLDRFDGSCSTVEDSSCQIHVPNKIGDLSLKVFTMIKGQNKPKTLVKHISCK